MLRRKCSSPKARLLGQLLEMEMNRNKTCQSLNSTSWTETRIHAIENMEALITVAGKETGLSFWEGVSKNWEAKIFKVWRERKTILEEMMKMPNLLGHEILPIVGVIQALALVDLEQGVRDIAVSFVCAFVYVISKLSLDISTYLDSFLEFKACYRPIQTLWMVSTLQSLSCSRPHSVGGPRTNFQSS